MNGQPPATNNHGPLIWPAVLAIAGLFLCGCQAQQAVTCSASTTTTSADARCDINTDVDVDNP